MPRHARTAVHFAAFALAAALGAGCHHAPAARGGGPRPPAGELWLTGDELRQMRIVVRPAAREDIEDALLTSGRVAFDPARVTHVFSPVSGRITRVDAELGAHVTRDGTLAVILSPDVGVASSDLDKARADADAASRDAVRQRELVSEGAASRRDAEQAEAAARVAQAELSRTRERMRLFREANYDRVTQGYRLTAPLGGEVIARAASVGQEVAGQYSGGGSPELFTIGELDRVQVFADVYEVDMGRVHVGAHATVGVVAYPDRTFAGTVDYVSGALDPQTRTARVRCTIDNADHALRPEMFATVAIDVVPRRALAVPRDAVLHLGEQRVVFVVAGRTADGRVRIEQRPVAVDEGTGGRDVPIERGVAEGEAVVTSGAIQLVGLEGE